ncbi:MAG: membrane protein insertase YidC [Candidatus Brocadiia bacterium]
MDRRTIIAFTLIGLLTVLFFWSQQRRLPIAPTPTEVAAPASAEPVSGAVAGTSSPTVSPAVEAGPQPLLNDDILLPPAGLKYQMRWSNQGACLREARLTDYRQRRNEPEGVLLLDAPANGAATFALQDPRDVLPLDSRNYELLENSGARLAFATTFANGLSVTKEYIPAPGKYELGVRVTLKNTGKEPLDTQYAIVAAGRLVAEAGLSAEVYGAIGRRTSPENVNIDREFAGSVRKQPFLEVNNPREPMIWAGAGNRYFAAILSPKSKTDSTFGFIASTSIEILPQCDIIQSATGGTSLVDNVVVKVLTEKRTLKPGEAVADEYTYFLGPKEQNVLAQYPDIAGLTGLDYGWFGFFSRILLAILHGLYRVIPNYGVGIILMTLIVRVCVFPMTRKGQIAMYRMQKLQPLIKEMQEKYKDDRQRQGREMMELYRKHNANPMSGCWPMLLQLPILYGLWRMLTYAIDLRQQPFVFWITDLSKPDTIAAFGFPVHILPILMTISSLVQQMTMPKSADPQQAQTQKMMMFMPVLMCVMFYGFASGVTLYWLTSTTLGIVEQRIVKMQIKRMEARGDFAPEEEEAEKGGRQKFKRK